MIPFSISVIQQIGKFGFVGLGATFIHVVLMTLLVETGLASPMAANVFGFVPALLFSFFGHFRWTFNLHQGLPVAMMARIFTKFFASAVFGLLVNIFWVFLVVNILNWPYFYATGLIICATPVILFVISKFLVFKY